jgi:phytoene dehydrogenase-like protein
MSDSVDFVIVGSGINSLVCAAELAMRGRSVCVLERSDVLGGCIQTGEITRPGFRHDLFSMSYSLFVTAAHAPVLLPELERRGAKLLTAPKPTGVILPDGRSLTLSRSRDANIAAFDAVSPGDGAAYAEAMQALQADSGLVFGLLGQEPMTTSTLKLLGSNLYHRRPAGMMQFLGDALPTARKWLESSFQSDLVRALIAPWVLHTGIGPDSALSALMTKLVMLTIEGVGAPIVEGGSDAIVTAFKMLIESHGGKLLTGVDVARVIVEDARAIGVESIDGQRFLARQAVVCNMTPQQLYGRLLAKNDVPETVRQRADRFAFGRAGMQIHIALSAPPRWSDPALNDVALIHLTPGLDGVSRAVNEAERGLLPAEPTIALCQPSAIDPSRAPPGMATLWVQLLELPRRLRGDAAGTITVSANGEWTDDVAKAYGDRILSRMRQHITNFDEALLEVAILSPRDLERHNINLVGGDPYSGASSLDQFHLFRPLAGGHNHTTPVRGVYHIGASTHPGAGLSGMSGHMVAQRLLGR